jgi:hypothetical protein
MNVAFPKVLLVVLVFCLVVEGQARGAVIPTETRQHSEAVICIGDCLGPNENSVVTETIDGVAHANNIDGTLTTPSQARTAGRTSASEIAANATLRHRNGGSFRDYTSVKGRAIYSMNVLALDAGDVFLDFYLPPGFVEIEGNAEFRDFITLSALITANISVCSPECSNPLGTLFQLRSELTGGWETHELHNNVFSVDPNLDSSALTHDNVTVVESNGNFIRTKTWEYDAFSGRLPVGHFNAGDTFTLAYDMLAIVSADEAGFQTWAAAAINDPFFLSTDPLPQAPVFEFTQVPEPASAVLAMLGMLTLAICLRRRPRG